MHSRSRTPQAEVLPADTPALFATAVERAARLLGQGRIVGLPTETVYGLAGNALSDAAVAEIFRVKGRPDHNPLIVHVSDLDMARESAASWSEAADQLAHAFWPGPLTLVLPSSPRISLLARAGGDTVGIRWPSHPLMQAVIRKCGFPLAAPSANRSNQLSPTTAQHVFKDLGTQIPLIVDGGASHVGIESTVLDLTQSPVRILRPGIIHESALCSVLGSVASGQGAAYHVLRSPGQLPRHYCPRASLVSWRWDSDTDLTSRVANLGVPPAAVYVVAHTTIPAASDFGRVSVIPRDPEAFARALYAELHACDEASAKLIIVEEVPPAPEWSGVADRLRRASSPDILQ